MADPFNELLDLVLTIFELNFSEFMVDGPVSEIKVQDMALRIGGIYKKMDSIITRINDFPVNEIPPDTGVILAMVSRLCEDLSTIPGYDRYSDMLTTININKGMHPGQAQDITKGTNRLFNIKMDVKDLCFKYGWNHDILVFTLSADQYNRLLQRQDEARAKGEAAAAAANAFLEGAADDNPENAPAGYEPLPGSFRGDLYRKQQGLGPDIDYKIASYLIGGKRKSKTRKSDKRKRLRKRRNTRRKTTR